MLINYILYKNILKLFKIDNNVTPTSAKTASQIGVIPNIASINIITLKKIANVILVITVFLVILLIIGIDFSKCNLKI